ncbi:MAG: response regulator [Bacteroidota bacterium]
MNPKWILLADDDADDSELLRTAILDIAPKARIRVFSDGKQVVDFLEQHGNNDFPCTIVLDYNMPFFNGPQVLEHIAKYPLYKRVPKIIWSTSNAEEHQFISVQKGANRYFVKPSNQAEIDVFAREIVGLCQNGMQN